MDFIKQVMQVLYRLFIFTMNIDCVKLLRTQRYSKISFIWNNALHCLNFIQTYTGKKYSPGKQQNIYINNKKIQPTDEGWIL